MGSATIRIEQRQRRRKIRRERRDKDKYIKTEGAEESEESEENEKTEKTDVRKESKRTKQHFCQTLWPPALLFPWLPAPSSLPAPQRLTTAWVLAWLRCGWA